MYSMMVKKGKEKSLGTFITPFKEIYIFFQVMRAYHPLAETNPWMGNAGLNGGNNRLFDFPSVSAGGGGGDWGMGLISNQQSLYGSLAQQ